MKNPKDDVIFFVLTPLRCSAIIISLFNYPIQT